MSYFILTVMTLVCLYFVPTWWLAIIGMVLMFIRQPILTDLILLISIAF